MLKEAIDALVGLGKGKQGHDIFQIDRRTSRIIFRDGRPAIDVIDPEPARAHGADTLSSLVAMCGEYGDNKTTTVWLAPNSIVAVLDDTYRDDRITLALQISKQFESLTSRPEFPVRAAVKWLTNIMGCDDNHPCVQALRHTIFSKGSTNTQRNAHGAQSLGRSVESAVTGDFEIPKETTLILPVFVTPGLTHPYDVTVRVNVDTENEIIEFIVPADFCVAMFTKALSDVAEDIPYATFFGRP